MGDLVWMMRRNIGVLSWITAVCRLDLATGVSLLQQESGNEPTGRLPIKANKIVQDLKSSRYPYLLTD